jgi:cytochrome P450
MAEGGGHVQTAIDIYDPDNYVDETWVHDTFRELRRTQPVYWQDMPGEPGYWAVLKHADVTHVARHPEVFSAQTLGVVLEDPMPEMREHIGSMLLMMDPPKHTAYRKPLAESFKAKVIADMGNRIRQVCREIMAVAREQGEVEFVHDVAGLLPNQVIGELFGIPQEDWADIRRWAEESTSGQDPELAGADDYGNRTDPTAMTRYAMALAAERRTQEPREDLTSLILAGNFGGNPMSDVEFGSFFNQLVVAGNDTTKGMLSAGVHELLRHPDQLAALRADHSLLPGAVEEVLRFANPLHYFRRTAVQDTELRGVEIKAGDKVAMMYTSANRDEDVFTDPDRFDIRRSPNPHLSFGIAQHFCLGVHLARLEGRIFFEELFDAFPSIEQTGEARRIRSNLNNGLKALPLRLA